MAINVDERYELLSLIFRLAGREEFCALFTPYQNTLLRQFDMFNSHPAVSFAHNLNFGYDAVGKLAVHMKYENSKFLLIDETSNLLDCGRWNKTSIGEFIALVNKFYIDTNFAMFFQKNTPYYKEVSARFNNQLYNRLNKNWFIAHGLAPEMLQAIISPADSNNGYCAVICNADRKLISVSPILPDNINYSGWMNFLVHEVSHSFSNPTAYAWYQENEKFRKQCDDSVNTSRNPSYTNGVTMAGEYVTRANTIMYMVENENADPLRLLLDEKSRGFP